MKFSECWRVKFMIVTDTSDCKLKIIIAPKARLPESAKNLLWDPELGTLKFL